MFIEIYKCKMCGEKIQKVYADNVVADTELLINKEPERHFCKNGDMGIAEFIGFKRVNE